MEFLVLWLGTSVTSFGMEIANELRMFKDVADAGYKIDIKRLSELGKQLNPNATKTTLLSIVIPIYNIIKVLQKIIKYNNARPMVLDQLSVMDALEEMSEMEKQEYLKKQSGLNALLVSFKSEMKLTKDPSIEIENDNENLSDALSSNSNLDLSHSSDDRNNEFVKPVEELSINEQRQASENLKNELLKEQQATTKKHNENEPILKRKRK